MSFSSNEKLFIQAGSFTCVWIFQLDDCQVSNGGNSEPASPQIGIDIPVRGTEALARASRGDPVHEALTDDQKSGLRRIRHDWENEGEEGNGKRNRFLLSFFLQILCNSRENGRGREWEGNGQRLEIWQFERIGKKMKEKNEKR